MPKASKSKIAKISGRNVKSVAPRSDENVHLVMISDGHRVHSVIPRKTYCGLEWSGWEYGQLQDIACFDCQVEVSK